MEVVNPTRIKVFGIGGGGSNAVNRMYLDGIEGVELLQSIQTYSILLLSLFPTKYR